ELRPSAAYALGKIGRGNKAVVRSLIQTLNDKDDVDTWGAAAMALGSLGSESKGAVPTLVKALHCKGIKRAEHRNFVASCVCWALGQIGNEAEAAVPDLVETLTNKRVALQVRTSAARALGNIGKSARKAISSLGIIVNDAMQDAKFRQLALE